MDGASDVTSVPPVSQMEACGERGTQSHASTLHSGAWDSALSAAQRPSQRPSHSPGGLPGCTCRPGKDSTAT